MAAQLGDQRAVLYVVVAVGLVWIVLGILTCLKQMWAVYAGLVLSYLSLVGNLINLNICGVIIILLAILQAHRVISWAGRMRAAGFPVTARPS